MRFIVTCFYLISLSVFSQIQVRDSESMLPVSYATISFGNGQGIFADNEGEFVFTKTLYPDIDSLFVSALGYKPLSLSSDQIPSVIQLTMEANKLDEIVISAPERRKYKLVKKKPFLDDDYYKCWLPTIESEIAVFIPNTMLQDQRLQKVQFPIALEAKDWKKRNKNNADKQQFSTLFKVRLYENKDYTPGSPLTNETIVFLATEKNGDYYDLDLEEYAIIMPENGLFVSLQVLGYTDKEGKLLPNKKYKEIKGRDGMVKIPTNFRPLLPFTSEINQFRTFIKRVFIHGNTWRAFQPKNGIESSLLDKGYYNYGVGVTLKVFKD